MNRSVFILLAIILITPTTSIAKLDIFACAPEWGALAKEIGGAEVTVFTASKASQDVHHLRAKPSFLAKMRKTELVFCTGAALESGWLPVLLQKAGSSKVQAGQVGHLLASEYVEKLEMPELVDRSMGDIHGEGNPHIHLNPHNLILIADELTKRLSLLSPTKEKLFLSNLEIFKQRWQENIEKWEQKAQPLRNMNVVVYHQNWIYLLNWLNLNRITTLEPVPGIPPRVSHLETVLASVKNQDIKAILLTPYQQNNAAAWLSEHTNIPVVTLPYTVGGSKNAKDLKTLFDETLQILLEVSA